MALFNALMRYKTEGRVRSFDMHGEKKATIRTATGASVVIYMSTDYIVGEAEVWEAVEAPAAKYLLYNNWDTVGEAARREAKRLGVEVHGFGSFGHRIDELNAGR
jgi:hypothetical protein